VNTKEALLKNLRDNLQRSKDFIRVATVYESRAKLRKTLRQPIVQRIRKGLGKVEDHSFANLLVEKRFLPFAEHLKGLYEAGCPQVLVYSVSCFEDFVREFCSMQRISIDKRDSLQCVKTIEEKFGESCFQNEN
jgi:hypothetical protein